jgi:tight adherence protein C
VIAEGAAGIAAASAILALAPAIPARPVRRPSGDRLAPAPARWRGLPVLRIVGLRDARRRRRRIDDDVPQLLDLLAAASAAGLSVPLALDRAVEGVAGPLGDELSGALERVRLGARWRDELDSAAERLGLPDLRRAVRVLVRAERLGTPLASACAELATSVRHGRRTRALERARTAPVKMLFPLVFLVLPAFLLLTVVPVLVATLESIAEGR